MVTAARPLRALIVDDEAPARERLRRLLLAHADVIEVVGAACDGREALAACDRYTPDAIFLDVQMPEADGLAVAASLPDPAPAIVFVTAFDHYALPAFDAAAVDYLLKPVDAEHIARAVQRLRARGPRGSGASSRPAPSQLLIPDRGGRVHVVAVAEIDWLEAADNYVVVHTATAAPLLRRSLSALLADLCEGFVRTQRGAAVAIAQVRGVEALGRGDAVVVLASGARVPCSRQHRARLMVRLQPPR
jgi:two-component system LytT family response regulator